MKRAAGVLDARDPGRRPRRSRGSRTGRRGPAACPWYGIEVSPRLDPDAVDRVVAELVLDAVREAGARAEQHHQHEDAPGDREAGQRGAQLVARDHVEDLLPGVEVDHPAASAPAAAPLPRRRPPGGDAVRLARPGHVGRAVLGDAPSTRWIRRSVISAMSCSWVTITTVTPSRWIPLQDLHDLARGRRVERAGRLVGEQDLGPRDQRAGDRDALLLAARELARQVLGAVGEADLARGTPRASRLRSRRGTPW